MKECRCDRCAHYIKLEVPYHYEKDGYPDGVTVYGFCAKDVRRNFAFYPVYLPDGGVCKAFKHKGGAKSTSDGEMSGQIVMKEA